MRAPEPVRDHPNATYVLFTTPFSALVGFLLIRFHLPAEAVASIGSCLSSAFLVVSDWVRKVAGGCWHAVWTLGIVGCARRIWKGATDG